MQIRVDWMGQRPIRPDALLDAVRRVLTADRKADAANPA